MDRITQEAYHRQRVIKWARKCGVAATAIRYHMSRKTVYKWLNRYDDTIESLKNLPKTPHHCPNRQSPEEIKLVHDWLKNMSRIACWLMKKPRSRAIAEATAASRKRQEK